MVKRINVGFLVHKDSMLFPLVKHTSLQVNLKGWKIWEDRIENIIKNDIFVYDDEPMMESSAGDINAYFLNGGAIIQLFPAEVEESADYIIKDGELASEKYAEILENVDLNKIAGDISDLNVRILKEKGIFVYFSKNIFSEDLIGEFTGAAIDESDEEEPTGSKGDPNQNLHLFYNMIRFLTGLQDEMDIERQEELRIPGSKVYLFIHGQSLWLSNADVKIEVIIEAVFKDLGIESELPQIYKEPEYRGIDPDNLERFPRVYYYHRTFRDGDDDENLAVQNTLAQDFLEQARKVHAEVRTEKNWDSSTVPLFYSDVARLSMRKNLKGTIYALPPMIIAGKSPKMNLKLFQKCLLEPLASQGTFSRLVDVSGPEPEITSLYHQDDKLKARKLNEKKKILLLHGPELVKKLKEKNLEETIPRLRDSLESDAVFEQALKILIHVKVDKLDLQRRIKDYSFQMKKVDDKMKERLKRRIERMQDRLHSHMHVSKSKKILEEHGFKTIEIQDDWKTDENIRIFLIDQVLPYVMAKKVSGVYHVMPRRLEMYLTIICRPLLPYSSFNRLTVTE